MPHGKRGQQIRGGAIGEIADRSQPEARVGGRVRCLEGDAEAGGVAQREAAVAGELVGVTHVDRGETDAGRADNPARGVVVDFAGSGEVGRAEIRAEAVESGTISEGDRHIVAEYTHALITKPHGEIGRRACSQAGQVPDREIAIRAAAGAAQGDAEAGGIADPHRSGERIRETHDRLAEVDCLGRETSRRVAVDRGSDRKVGRADVRARAVER